MVVMRRTRVVMREYHKSVHEELNKSGHEGVGVRCS